MRSSKEHVDIIEDIEVLEDEIIRLEETNRIAYDEKFHLYVIGEYSKLVNKINNSNIDDIDKALFVDYIKNLFKSNISIDKQ